MSSAILKIVYGVFLCMVWLKKLGGKQVYICGACDSGYADAATALKSEEYCRKTSSCSPDIAKKAIYSSNSE